MTFPKMKNYQVLTRVDSFFGKFVSLFPTYTAAGEAFAAIGSYCKKLTALITESMSFNSQILATSKTRAAVRNALKAQLRSINRAARALHLSKLHWRGQRTTDQSLTAAGREFATDAESVKEQLILHGLTPAFMESLLSAVHDFEAVILAHGEAKSSRAAAIKEFDKIMDEAWTYFKRVEALVLNAMADNPTVMAAWNTAVRINKSGGSKASTKTASDSPGPPVSGTPPETAASAA